MLLLLLVLSFLSGVLALVFLPQIVCPILNLVFRGGLGPVKKLQASAGGLWAFSGIRVVVAPPALKFLELDVSVADFRLRFLKGSWRFLVMLSGVKVVAKLKSPFVLPPPAAPPPPPAKGKPRATVADPLLSSSAPSSLQIGMKGVGSMLLVLVIHIAFGLVALKVDSVDAEVELETGGREETDKRIDTEDVMVVEYYQNPKYQLKRKLHGRVILKDLEGAPTASLGHLYLLATLRSLRVFLRFGGHSAKTVELPVSGFPSKLLKSLGSRPPSSTAFGDRPQLDVPDPLRAVLRLKAAVWTGAVDLGAVEVDIKQITGFLLANEVTELIGLLWQVVVESKAAAVKAQAERKEENRGTGTTEKEKEKEGGEREEEIEEDDDDEQEEQDNSPPPFIPLKVRVGKADLTFMEASHGSAVHIKARQLKGRFEIAPANVLIDLEGRGHAEAICLSFERDAGGGEYLHGEKIIFLRNFRFSGSNQQLPFFKQHMKLTSSTAGGVWKADGLMYWVYVIIGIEKFFKTNKRYFKGAPLADYVCPDYIQEAKQLIASQQETAAAKGGRGGDGIDTLAIDIESFARISFRIEIRRAVVRTRPLQVAPPPVVLPGGAKGKGGGGKGLASSSQSSMKLGGDSDSPRCYAKAREKCVILTAANFTMHLSDATEQVSLSFHPVKAYHSDCGGGSLKYFPHGASRLLLLLDTRLPGDRAGEFGFPPFPAVGVSPSPDFLRPSPITDIGADAEKDERRGSIDAPLKAPDEYEYGHILGCDAASVSIPSRNDRVGIRFGECRGEWSNSVFPLVWYITKGAYIDYRGHHHSQLHLVHNPPPPSREPDVGLETANISLNLSKNVQISMMGFVFNKTNPEVMTLSFLQPCIRAAPPRSATLPLPPLLFCNRIDICICQMIPDAPLDPQARPEWEADKPPKRDYESNPSFVPLTRRRTVELLESPEPPGALKGGKGKTEEWVLSSVDRCGRRLGIDVVELEILLCDVSDLHYIMGDIGPNLGAVFQNMTPPSELREMIYALLTPEERRFAEARIAVAAVELRVSNLLAVLLQCSRPLPSVAKVKAFHMLRKSCSHPVRVSLTPPPSPRAGAREDAESDAKGMQQSSGATTGKAAFRRGASVLVGGDVRRGHVGSLEEDIDLRGSNEGDPGNEGMFDDELFGATRLFNVSSDARTRHGPLLLSIRGRTSPADAPPPCSTEASSSSSSAQLKRPSSTPLMRQKQTVHSPVRRRGSAAGSSWEPTRFPVSEEDLPAPQDDLFPSSRPTSSGGGLRRDDSGGGLQYRLQQQQYQQQQHQQQMRGRKSSVDSVGSEREPRLFGALPQISKSPPPGFKGPEGPGTQQSWPYIYSYLLQELESGADATKRAADFFTHANDRRFDGEATARARERARASQPLAGGLRGPPLLGGRHGASNEGDFMHQAFGDVDDEVVSAGGAFGSSETGACPPPVGPLQAAPLAPVTGARGGKSCVVFWSRIYPPVLCIHGGALRFELVQNALDPSGRTLPMNFVTEMAGLNVQSYRPQWERGDRVQAQKTVGVDLPFITVSGNITERPLALRQAPSPPPQPSRPGSPQGERKTIWEIARERKLRKESPERLFGEPPRTDSGPASRTSTPQPASQGPGGEDARAPSRAPGWPRASDLIHTINACSLLLSPTPALTSVTLTVDTQPSEVDPKVLCLPPNELRFRTDASVLDILAGTEALFGWVDRFVPTAVIGIFEKVFACMPPPTEMPWQMLAPARSRTNVSAHLRDGIRFSAALRGLSLLDLVIPSLQTSILMDSCSKQKDMDKADTAAKAALGIRRFMGFRAPPPDGEEYPRRGWDGRGGNVSRVQQAAGEPNNRRLDSFMSANSSEVSTFQEEKAKEREKERVSFAGDTSPLAPVREDSGGRERERDGYTEKPKPILFSDGFLPVFLPLPEGPVPSLLSLTARLPKGLYLEYAGARNDAGSIITDAPAVTPAAPLRRTGSVNLSAVTSSKIRSGDRAGAQTERDKGGDPGLFLLQLPFVDLKMLMHNIQPHFNITPDATTDSSHGTSEGDRTGLSALVCPYEVQQAAGVPTQNEFQPPAPQETLCLRVHLDGVSRSYYLQKDAPVSPPPSDLPSIYPPLLFNLQPEHLHLFLQIAGMQPGPGDLLWSFLDEIFADIKTKPQKPTPRDGSPRRSSSGLESAEGGGKGKGMSMTFAGPPEGSGGKTAKPPMILDVQGQITDVHGRFGPMRVSLAATEARKYTPLPPTSWEAHYRPTPVTIVRFPSGGRESRTEMPRQSSGSLAGYGDTVQSFETGPARQILWTKVDPSSTQLDVISGRLQDLFVGLEVAPEVYRDKTKEEQTLAAMRLASVHQDAEDLLFAGLQSERPLPEFPQASAHTRASAGLLHGRAGRGSLESEEAIEKGQSNQKTSNRLFTPFLAREAARRSLLSEVQKMQQAGDSRRALCASSQRLAFLISGVFLPPPPDVPAAILLPVMRLDRCSFHRDANVDVSQSMAFFVRVLAPRLLYSPATMTYSVHTLKIFEATTAMFTGYLAILKETLSAVAEKEKEKVLQQFVQKKALGEPGGHSGRKDSILSLASAATSLASDDSDWTSLKLTLHCEDPQVNVHFISARENSNASASSDAFPSQASPIPASAQARDAAKQRRSPLKAGMSPARTSVRNLSPAPKGKAGARQSTSKSKQDANAPSKGFDFDPSAAFLEQMAVQSDDQLAAIYSDHLATLPPLPLGPARPPLPSPLFDALPLLQSHLSLLVHIARRTNRRLNLPSRHLLAGNPFAAFGNDWTNVGGGPSAGPTFAMDDLQIRAPPRITAGPVTEELRGAQLVLSTCEAVISFEASVETEEEPEVPPPVQKAGRSLSQASAVTLPSPPTRSLSPKRNSTRTKTGGAESCSPAIRVSIPDGTRPSVGQIAGPVKLGEAVGGGRSVGPSYREARSAPGSPRVSGLIMEGDAEDEKGTLSQDELLSVPRGQRSSVPILRQQQSRRTSRPQLKSGVTWGDLDNSQGQGLEQVYRIATGEPNGPVSLGGANDGADNLAQSLFPNMIRVGQGGGGGGAGGGKSGQAISLIASVAQGKRANSALKMKTVIQIEEADGYTASMKKGKLLWLDQKRGMTRGNTTTAAPLDPRFASLFGKPDGEELREAARERGLTGERRGSLDRPSLGSAGGNAGNAPGEGGSSSSSSGLSLCFQLALLKAVAEGALPSGAADAKVHIPKCFATFDEAALQHTLAVVQNVLLFRLAGQEGSRDSGGGTSGVPSASSALGVSQLEKQQKDKLPFGAKASVADYADDPDGEEDDEDEDKAFVEDAASTVGGKGQDDEVIENIFGVSREKIRKALADLVEKQGRQQQQQRRKLSADVSRMQSFASQYIPETADAMQRQEQKEPAKIKIQFIMEQVSLSLVKDSRVFLQTAFTHISGGMKFHLDFKLATEFDLDVGDLSVEQKDAENRSTYVVTAQDSMIADLESKTRLISVRGSDRWIRLFGYSWHVIDMFNVQANPLSVNLTQQVIEDAYKFFFPPPSKDNPGTPLLLMPQNTKAQDKGAAAQATGAKQAGKPSSQAVVAKGGGAKATSDQGALPIAPLLFFNNVRISDVHVAVTFKGWGIQKGVKEPVPISVKYFSKRKKLKTFKALIDNYMWHAGRDAAKDVITPWRVSDWRKKDKDKKKGVSQRQFIFGGL
uniref:FMP27 GFWDK domain-containing protein n=1 Tax=Chromera velia CCMP2878 TaxID=1169474 RepID=A0A0G4GJI9_9ALVE|eukprot:Cvel_4798.t1-p1 / transcript=Cvel_4798.t1 / gene=Cvel_4798 / organism=Chromera_velia_CCMP2878 / gene_product=hypothetical protein / transcript_product=hypothetical protein / location=Cvel_scaffold214:76927-94886(-) / protein_length=3656 / sequence_SO=supercontig / SO=protein_coding / is_pseudo=false